MWQHYLPPTGPHSILHALAPYDSRWLDFSVLSTLFFIWMVRRWRICLLLLLNPSTHRHSHTTLHGCSKGRVASICKNLLHFILSWGNLPGREKVSLSVYEMLMWRASALLCAQERRGPVVSVKATCSVCVSMCEMARQAKLPEPECRQTWKRNKCCRWYEYICILNPPCTRFLLFGQGSRKQ